MKVATFLRTRILKNTCECLLLKGLPQWRLALLRVLRKKSEKAQKYVSFVVKYSETMILRISYLIKLQDCSSLNIPSMAFRSLAPLLTGMHCEITLTDAFKTHLK